MMIPSINFINKPHVVKDAAGKILERDSDSYETV